MSDSFGPQGCPDISRHKRQPEEERMKIDWAYLRKG